MVAERGPALVKHHRSLLIFERGWLRNEGPGAKNSRAVAVEPVAPDSAHFTRNPIEADAIEDSKPKAKTPGPPRRRGMGGSELIDISAIRSE
jgi:hypothetical protein